MDNEFFIATSVLPEWTARSGRAVQVKLRTLPELEAFWRAHRSRFPYAVTAWNNLQGQDLLNPFDWVFGATPEDVVKAVTRWEQCGIHAKWSPWAEDSQANADMATISPVKLSHRGWWVLMNYPDADDQFGWEGDESGAILDPAIQPEHMEYQFQLELFESWRENEQDLMAFSPNELDQFIDSGLVDRSTGHDYYGCQNNSEEQRLVM